MKRTIVIVLLNVCLVMHGRAQINSFWQLLNAPQGGTGTIYQGSGDTCFAYSPFPGGNNTFISTDFGNSWDLLPTPQIDSLDFSEELFYGKTGKLFKILRYNNGGLIKNKLFKSVNLGQNWELVNDSIGPRKIYEAFNGILIGTNVNTLYRSLDGGISWEVVYNNIETSAPAVFNDWGDGTYSLQIKYQSVYLSYDEGASWSEVNLPNYNSRFFKGTNNVFFSLDSYVINRSNNGGISWESIVNSFPNGTQYKSMLVLSNGRLLLTTHLRELWYSDNSGDTWQTLLLNPVDAPSELSIQLTNGIILGKTTDNFVRSLDQGETWQIAEFGPRNGYCINFKQLSPDHALYATGSGLWKSIDSCQSWIRIMPFTGNRIEFDSDLFAALNSDTFIVTNSGFNLFITFDSGITFSEITPPVGLLPDLANYFIHPFTGRIFANSPYGTIYSDDFGLTWQPCLNDEHQLQITYDNTGNLFALCRNVYNVDKKIFKSDDGGATWMVLNSISVPFGGTIHGIATTPDNKLVVLVGTWFETKLAVSEDGGNQWIYRNVPQGQTFPAQTKLNLYVNDLGHIYTPTLGSEENWISTDLGVSWFSLPPITNNLSTPAIWGTEDGNIVAFHGDGNLYKTLSSTHQGGYLKGNIRKDADSDCFTQDAQVGLKNWTLTVEGPYGVNFGNTGNNGSYQIFADTGTYTIRAHNPQNIWWALCDSIQTAVIDTLLAVDTVNFVALALVDCPLMTADVTAPRLRRCFNNTVYIQTCNIGTETADSAWVDVFLDPNLTLVSSTLPHDSVDLNSWRFYVGDMASGDCAQFNFTVYVNCDSTVLGQTHCISAHAFPDTLCTEVPNWSGANLEARVTCQDTIVHFELENTGTGPSQPLDYIIIVDDVVLMQGEETYDIAELVSFEQPANGQTWRIESQQEPGHPFSTVALAFAEGCGGFGSLGFINQFSVNGITPSVDRFCLENIGAYDPNDKQGFPRGYGDDNRIAPGQDLEYLIRFQNTGTDTAFTVRIADTLSTWLDPASIVPGVSSHPYSWTLSGEGIVTFLFENILLPDSNTNLAGSQGFVNFRIQQREQVPLNTVILNSAAIYFDFNTPVITNETRHTIGVDILNDAHVPAKPITAEVSVLVSPNPATDEAVFRLRRGAFQGHRVMVTDAFGRVVHRGSANGDNYLWRVQGLPRGWYAWQVLDGKGKQVGAGKIILN